MFVTKVHFKIGSTARDQHGPSTAVISKTPGHVQSGWICFQTSEGKGLNIDLSEIWKIEVLPSQEEVSPQGEV